MPYAIYLFHRVNSTTKDSSFKSIERFQLKRCGLQALERIERIAVDKVLQLYQFWRRRDQDTCRSKISGGLFEQEENKSFL